MSLRIGFIGSGGDFSLLPFQYLRTSEYHLAMIGVNGITPQLNSDPRLQVVQSQGENVQSLAAQANIPLLDFRLPMEQLISLLTEFRLDLIIVACYNKKIPQSILSIPKHGFLNIHPSLLPAYRGPVPLFWEFQNGRSEYGISLHKMDADFDTGAIVSQKVISFADGVNHFQANEQLGKLACDLLADYLTALENNTDMEIRQQAANSSYMSYPKEKDFLVNNQWSAQRIYNFICATLHWGQSYPCQVDKQTFRLKDVISYESEENSEMKGNYSLAGKVITIKCRPGILKARLE